MSEQKRSGRRPKDQKRVPLGVRITPEMRAQLENRAVAAGRSVTQQVELLLEFAIRDEHAIEAAFDFAFARRTAGSLLLLAEAITFSAQQAAAIAGDKGRGGDWLDQPFVFDQ